MKLPKPVKRGDSYRIGFMLNGQRYTCTRDTARECEQWAAKKILELKAGASTDEKSKTIKMTFGALFEQYYTNIGQHKPSSRWIKSQFSAFDKNFGRLSGMDVGEITPRHLTDWRNKRLKEISPSSVLREISLYSAVFSYAQKELFLLDADPWFAISKPRQAKPRDRRITDDEIAAICKRLDYPVLATPITKKQFVAWAFLFAIETAMRKGEILGLTKDDVFEKHVHLSKTKNGEERDVPLTKKARELLALIDLNANPNNIINVYEGTLNSFFRRAKIALKIEDLHFHDTRHEAITRLVNKQKLPVEILAKMTGHRTIKILINTYYNPDVGDIADMLD